MRIANEKWLIDANVVLAKQFTTGISDASGNYYGYADVVFVDDIENAQTVDAMEVVHGRWEKDGTCSNCKGMNPTYRENKWSAQFPDFPGNLDHLNYCPHCGANMDEETKFVGICGHCAYRDDCNWTKLHPKIKLKECPDFSEGDHK